MRNAKTMVKRVRAGRVVIVPNEKVSKVINLFQEREAIQVTDSDLPDHSYVMLKDRDQEVKATMEDFLEAIDQSGKKIIFKNK